MEKDVTQVKGFRIILNQHMYCGIFGNEHSIRSDYSVNLVLACFGMCFTIALASLTAVIQKPKIRIIIG